MRLLACFLTILVLLVSYHQVGAQSTVTIESVSGTVNTDTLVAGQIHGVTFRFNNAAGAIGTNYQTSNSWIIYSPDGADWGYVQGVTLPAFNLIGWSLVHNNHFDKSAGTGNWGLPQPTGAGNLSGGDTTGVLLSAIFLGQGGLPGGFDDEAYAIEFTSQGSDAGRHICIDTSTAMPSGQWEWINSPEFLVPDWSGSQCWVVSEVGCCVGRVGDANGSGDDEPSVADIGRIVEFLFISGAPFPCLHEADVNQSGGPNPQPTDVSVADIGVLVDYLFITGTPLFDCF